LNEFSRRKGQVGEVVIALDPASYLQRLHEDADICGEEVSMDDCRQSSANLRISHDPSSYQLDYGQVRLRAPTRHLAACMIRPTGRAHDMQHKSPSYGDMKPIQCRLARTALGWGVVDLAKAAGVSTQTVVRLERGEELRETTLARIQAVLEDAGIEFIPADGGGVGVRFRNPS
jgi:DNA-binding XRE family transcriptional regulator